MHDSLYQNWSSPILKPAARSMLCSAGLHDAGKTQTKTQAIHTGPSEGTRRSEIDPGTTPGTPSSPQSAPTADSDASAASAKVPEASMSLAKAQSPSNPTTAGMPCACGC